MYGVNIRTNVSIGVERSGDFYLILFWRMRMKGNIKLFEKTINFADILQSIQMKKN